MSNPSSMAKMRPLRIMKFGLHHEFQLGEVSWTALSAASPAVATAAPYYQSEPTPADGD
jgi:hypothetical protein